MFSKIKYLWVIAFYYLDYVIICHTMTYYANLSTDDLFLNNFFY